MTVTLGVDPHKASHTVVATDPVGRQLDQTTSRGTRTSDHQELIGWARQHWPERTWAVEDCRHVAGRLLAAGERVVLVPPRLMAQVRQASRVPGKSDPIDALAVARAALAEPKLPQARLDGPARELKLLVGHREDLVAERTRVENRLRWHLHDLDPERAALLPTRHLEQRRVLDELEAWLAELPASVQVAIVRELVGRCRELTLRANQLQADLSQRVMRVCPRLLSLPGCGVLTAAKIAAEVAGVGRFRSEAALAMHAGAAPLECSSGAWQRHRLSRVGNRQLNAALHRIAVTQLRVHPPAQAYLTRLQATGKSKREALRVLKRRLVRVIYNLLQADLHHAQVNSSAAPLPAHEPAA
jgi:transposase